jgi:hypothetical protein
MTVKSRNQGTSVVLTIPTSLGFSDNVEFDVALKKMEAYCTHQGQNFLIFGMIIQKMF